MERDSRPLKQLLADRYRIDHELGRGGFATVYQVWNPRLERAEALKVLAPGHEADEDFSKRFTQEVRLAAALEHPSIVKVYDFGETGGVYWYSMQLVAGRTLSAELRERGPLGEREVARIALPLLDALAYSHERGIIHRDLKPENVILDHDGRPFLMDFGIAKSAGSLVKTQTGFLLGTPAYVAPEQAQGKPIDGRADLYALGVTLYKVASRHYPFEAADPLQAVILRLTEPPRPLSDARPGIDPAFASVVMRALERDPARRFESARAMREALAAYLAARPAETTATRVLPSEGLRASAAAEPQELPPDATVMAPTDLAGDSRVVSSVERPRITSALGAPSRRSLVVPLAAGFVVVLAALGATALFVFGPGRVPGPGTSGPPAVARPEPLAAPEPTLVAPAPPPTVAPTVPPPVAPTATVAPLPTATSPPPFRPTRRSEPEPAPMPRPVTAPERLTPEPPFAGVSPAGCSGAEITVGFAVDEQGNLVGPRVFPSEAPPECGRFVLEALPRWKWRPAADAAGVPVRSTRLVVYLRLP